MTQNELASCEFSKPQYTVEYLLKGEIKWRRTMTHPLEHLQDQVYELWDSKGVAATRMVAIQECVRLLNEQEIHATQPKEGASHGSE